MIKVLVCRLLGHRPIFIEAKKTAITYKCVNCGKEFKTEYRTEDFLE